MFAECRAYLIQKLKESGIRMEPITTEKALKIYGNSHVGAVLFESETLVRSGSKRIYKGEAGDGKTRVKRFDRELTFGVIIGEYDADKVDAIYEAFLGNLGKGLYIRGNFITVEPTESEWVGAEDSILTAKVAVQVKITCYGGVYADTHRLKLNKEEVEMDVQKED